ncbi:unnamed protein product [Protopolystoma xenopodis]|uniref:Uncharacterized protein n=1 Tax=Protopolystoma xenopodis TaxID=117903 RepID=A0A3S5AJ75_9PLAT|nr:unnamed protein product [Protopolystoma xenopodis]
MWHAHRATQWGALCSPPSRTAVGLDNLVYPTCTLNWRQPITSLQSDNPAGTTQQETRAEETNGRTRIHKNVENKPTFGRNEMSRSHEASGCHLDVAPKNNFQASSLSRSH